MVTAIVFVKAEVARIPEVAEAIADLVGVSEVYSVTGAIDLIAIVRVSSHDEIAEVVSDQLNKVPGVLTPRPTSRSGPTPRMTSRRRSPLAAEPVPASRVLVVAMITALSAIVIAVILAVVSLHQPTLTPITIPSRSAL
jgi:hypothetical protein